MPGPSTYRCNIIICHTWLKNIKLELFLVHQKLSTVEFLESLIEQINEPCKDDEHLIKSNENPENEE